MDYIGRDELLEALKRVGGFLASFWLGNNIHSCDVFNHLWCNFIL